ncbi:MAG: DNA recombination protein RmuC [Alphaproteobacteria bacterium]|nr:MAG: DNA recombination protein RmuC [Alphaproteobacteria bacterium]
MSAETIAALALLCAGVVGIVLWLAVRMERARAQRAGEREAFARLAADLQTTQQELAGRISQLTENHSRAQAAMAKALEERFDALSGRLGESLAKSATDTAKTLGELQTRLSVIDEAQKHITELSGQVVGLQDILANKQARGAFGEVQLNAIVQNALPPSAYSFQTTLSNGRRADCLIKLPKPPGDIVIDAKFPLESYHALRNADDAGRKQAEKRFADDILKHVRAISERYIIEGETAESALMFLPSEAVYAELHANFPGVVEKSYASRVWIVSPTTLMATLNTVRAVLKDARMREQAHVIQAEVRKLLDDVARLDTRVQNLSRHFGQAEEDLRQIGISSDKIQRRAERIEELELEDRDDKVLGATSARLSVASSKAPVEGR